jgi:hypothetical protein
MRGLLRSPSLRDLPKKLRIQLKIQSVRLKRKLDAGFIVYALPLGGRIQKIDFIHLYYQKNINITTHSI